MKKYLMAFFMVVLAFGLSACHKKYIENTKIPDTEDNRMILELLETYRAALEEKDAEKLLSLCAPFYFEDMGNTNKNDDFTLEELKAKVLPEVFTHTDELYINIIVDELETNKNKGHVDFRYDYRASIVLPAGKKWLDDTAVNRFELVKIDGKWLVGSGL